MNARPSPSCQRCCYWSARRRNINKQRETFFHRAVSTSKQDKTGKVPHKDRHAQPYVFADHSVAAARLRFDGEASINSSESSALSLLFFSKPLLFVFLVRSASLHSQKEGGTCFLKSVVSAPPARCGHVRERLNGNNSIWFDAENRIVALNHTVLWEIRPSGRYRAEPPDRFMAQMTTAALEVRRK